MRIPALLRICIFFLSFGLSVSLTVRHAYAQFTVGIPQCVRMTEPNGRPIPVGYLYCGGLGGKQQCANISVQSLALLYKDGFPCSSEVGCSPGGLDFFACELLGYSPAPTQNGSLFYCIANQSCAPEEMCWDSSACSSPPPNTTPPGNGGIGADSAFFEDLNKGIFGDSGPAKELTTPRGIISRLLPYLFTIGGLILFVMLVWGGFEMLTGAATPKSQESGKQRMTMAILGFILLFVSYWLAQLVEIIFGIAIL